MEISVGESMEDSMNRASRKLDFTERRSSLESESAVTNPKLPSKLGKARFRTG